MIRFQNQSVAEYFTNHHPKGEWSVVPAKRFCKEIDQRSATGEEELLGLSKARGVIRKSEMGQRASQAESYAGYKQVAEGDLVSNKMQAWNGMFGISPHEGITSPDYAVYRLHGSVERSFIEYACRTELYAREFHAKSRGMGTGFLRLNQSDFLSTPFVLPDLATQRTIVMFLDHETARIDLLIHNKERMVALVSPRFEALIHTARLEGQWQRFGYCAEPAVRPVPSASDHSFLPLGLYNRGRGFFKKEDTEFNDLGDSFFFFVEEGDLVFSGQFAWEGAVGLVSRSEHGCVVSHRYPVYVGGADVLSEYLFAYFRSHHGRFLMDNCSRGAAGRNRPLNVRILEKEKIPVPALALQREVRKIVEFERRLRAKIVPSIDRLREYRSALITAAVTGQIDVATWGNAGTADKQLDAIQAEFAG